jgi:two-component system, NtrC family, sensor kinase
VARRRAEAALREMSDTLEGRVEERTQRLSEALESPRTNHQMLEKAHASLETLHREMAARDKLTNLGLVAAGIAHEINNPMSFVTSNVKGLLIDLGRAGELPEDLRAYVDDILPATLDGIHRVNTIVGDLRRFARGDVDAFVEYDINEEVAAAMRISRARLKDRCKVEIELGEIPRLLGRPQQIAQVLINLVVNAAQAVSQRPAGVITVSTVVEHDHVLLRVRDNGVGMSAETRARLFEPFFTTKGVGEGTGLGLSVAYGIVASHGGSIQVESEVAQGSAFTVRLPRCRVSVSSRAA